MNKKTIEKEARKLLKGIVPCEWNQQPFIDIFVLAANWRINSVWHSPTEAPEENKPILVAFEDEIGGNAYYRIYFHPQIIKTWLEKKGLLDKILYWAYLDDLLPDGKEVQQ